MSSRILLFVAMVTVPGCATTAQLKQTQTQLKRLERKTVLQERVLARMCESRKAPKGKVWIYAPLSRKGPKQCYMVTQQSRRPMTCDWPTCEVHARELEKWRLRQACIIGKCTFPSKHKERYARREIVVVPITEPRVRVEGPRRPWACDHPKCKSCQKRLKTWRKKMRKTAPRPRPKVAP